MRRPECNVAKILILVSGGVKWQMKRKALYKLSYFSFVPQGQTDVGLFVSAS